MLPGHVGTLGSMGTTVALGHRTSDAGPSPGLCPTEAGATVAESPMPPIVGHQTIAGGSRLLGHMASIFEKKGKPPWPIGGSWRSWRLRAVMVGVTGRRFLLP